MEVIFGVLIYCVLHTAIGVGIDDCIAEFAQRNLIIPDLIYRGARTVGTIIFIFTPLWGVGLWVGAWVFKRIILAIFYTKDEWRSNLPYY